MLWTIVVILLILWLLGAFGNRISSGIPRAGGWIHTLLVIIIILVILQLLNVI
ncbi:MAG: lmo0937 family membrane protein [Brevefilum sp.]